MESGECRFGGLEVGGKASDTRLPITELVEVRGGRQRLGYRVESL